MIRSAIASLYLLCFFCLATSPLLAQEDPSDWGPITLKLAVASSGGETRLNGEVDILLGKDQPPLSLMVQDAGETGNRESQKLALGGGSFGRNMETRGEEHESFYLPKYAHSLSFEVGNLTSKIDAGLLTNSNSGMNIDLEASFVSMGYKFKWRRQLGLPKENENQYEIRWYSRVGAGLYSLEALEDTERVGFTATMGMEFAFGYHASIALASGVTYHRPISGVEIYDLKLGIAFNLPGKLP
jgi:hypothetical protein